jgi:transcriptional regulator with XRE-family HTH domain
MTPAEFGLLVTEWRFQHGLSQPQAGVALGVGRDTVSDWERQVCMPPQPALAEVLRRLRMPVNVPAIKAATQRKRPIEPREFARQVSQWRRRHRLTQEEAAAVLGTSRRNVWVWEAARALPWRPQDVLARLAQPFTRNEPKIAAVLPPKPKPLITPSRFARLLRDWRQAHRLTQLQACIALGLPRDQALISDWENGKAFPKPERLRRIVAALKQPPASGPGTHHWHTARTTEFGQQLRAWRKARGLKQADACAVLGLPRDQGLICRYERSEASPRKARMEHILGIIGS